MKETLNGIEIKKTFQELPIWTGKAISDSYGNKPILDYNGVPVFAELYALRQFMEKGYGGVWVDTFRKVFRTELPENKEPKMSLPQFVIDKLKDINPNGKINGTWDLIVWKNKELKFIELKRQKKDKIRQTQIDFLERALKAGIAIESFEIYEWVEE